VNFQVKRAKKFLDILFEHAPEKVVVVVTHSGFTRSLLLAVQREPYRCGGAAAAAATHAAEPDPAVNTCNILSYICTWGNIIRAARSLRTWQAVAVCFQYVTYSLMMLMLLSMLLLMLLLLLLQAPER
jgi:broad specificity phosphatase PhoE